MFRLTHYLRLIKGKRALKKPQQVPSGKGPVVIWNLTGACNLECVHCYASTKSQFRAGELDTGQALKVMDDLKKADCFSVILSGGEPLFRRDLFTLADRAKELGFFVSLSSNGTMIGDEEAARIRSAELDYVGISLDGIKQIHDRFRGVEGSFEGAVAGLLRCKERGVRVGVRFTLTKMNSIDLPRIFDFIEENEIDKLYLSHLVYSGRGEENSYADLPAKETRSAMEFVLEKAKSYVEGKNTIEIVTGNNEADAVFLLLKLMEDNPRGAQKLLPILKKWGGNSAGTGVGNIDPLGDVHPDPLMYDIKLGNVLKEEFPRIWYENSSDILRRLRERPRQLKGRCGECTWIDVCGGSNRTRAQRRTGNLWESDPACYITDEEISTRSFASDIQSISAVDLKINSELAACDTLGG